MGLAGDHPQARERLSGLIEVPGLAGSLTLNKGDFMRVGTRGATYLAYRKAIQESVQRQLAEWGDLDSPVEETPPKRRLAKSGRSNAILNECWKISPISLHSWDRWWSIGKAGKNGYL